MDITVKNWSGDAENWKYIFDEDLLTTLFSKEFVAQYREASKKPAYEAESGSTGDPFGYPIVGDQLADGCPLEDSRLPRWRKDGGRGGGRQFKLRALADEAEMKATVDEVVFDVREEGGQPLISDTSPDWRRGQGSPCAQRWRRSSRGSEGADMEVCGS
ncbi:MAG: hypothetical protein U5L46_02865 [Agrobacterium sp.]|nr:hypothetical protein [Agrobacterium sp.]